MRSTLPIAALAAAVFAAACSGDGGGPPVPPQPTLAVEWVLPASPDPFAGVDSWRVTVASAGTVFVQADFAPGESPVIENVLPRSNVVITLEACAGGCAAGSLLSRGRTQPFDITGEEQTVSMWFARAGAFNVPSGSYVARRRPAAGAFPDGRVLIAGGAVADVPVQNADLYDPATDTIAAVPPMPSPHAGAAAVMLTSTALLVAAGDGIAGASAYAEVWVHDPATGQGSWRAVSPLVEPRSEFGWAPMGNGLAVLVGGSNAGGILDSIEVFSWDGALGAWTMGEAFPNQQMGATVIALQGSALIAGGFLRNPNNGNQLMRVGVDLLRFDGVSWVRTFTGQLDRGRGWAEVIPAGPNAWLLAGGVVETMANPVPPGILTRTTTLLTLANGTTTSVVGPTLPVPAARRGSFVTFADGTSVFVGGDRSRIYEYPVPVDRVLRYDAANGTFPAFGASPGPTTEAFAAPLPDGTTLVVTDAGVFRWNP